MGGDQGLASDLDIFSAPLSRGFLVVSVLLSRLVDHNSPRTVYMHFHTPLFVLQSRSLPSVFKFWDNFLGIELKIGPLPGNSPLSIGLATAIRAIGLYTQSLFTCHKRQSSII